MLIEPTKITNFNRTDSELQAFALFVGFVAGKNSDLTVRVIDRLLARNKDKTPFEYLSELGENGIRNALVAAKAGQYTRLLKYVVEIMRLNLRECTFEELMNVHGMGPKSASFFLLHSRRDVKVCVLDTHILKWLKSKGVGNVPQNTPQNINKYIELSNSWFYLSEYHYPNLSPADRDLIIWSEMSGRL